MTRGSSAELTLRGAGLDDPLMLVPSFPARGITPIPGTLGKDSSQSRWLLSTGDDVTPGWHRLRLLTGRGLSNAKPFCIDTLPQVPSTGAAQSKDRAQLVPVPCVVAGRASAEASDYFRFSAAAGQRLSFEVIGRRLGSGLDPWIKLYDARTGRELPRGFCDDAPGLQSDARLSYTFAAAGDYLIEVRDALWRGGEDFQYRLRIGEFPCAIAPLPLAAQRGSKRSIGFAGPAVEGVSPIEVEIPSDPTATALSVTPIAGNGQAGWPVTLLVSDHEEWLVLEPTPAEGLPIPVPCGISGRFARAGQVDRFRVPVRKGQKYVVGLQPSEFQSSTEVDLAVRDAAGSVLARSQADKPGDFEFTPAADGFVVLSAEHLNYAFGPNEIYRITVKPWAPGFELTLSADCVTVAQGQSGLIPVQTLVRRGFAGPIELTVVGPEGISGTLLVSAGAESGSPPAPGQPPGAPFAMLPVRVAAGTPPGAYDVQVRAKATIDGRDVVAFASVAEIVSKSMGGLIYPPRQWLHTVAVGVLPRPPFELAARFDPPESVRGLESSLIVTAKRDDGFNEAISVAAAGLPANVSASPQVIGPGQSEARIAVKLGEAAALGRYTFTVLGQSKVGERSLTATLAADPLVVARPFELRTDPNPLTIQAGDKARLTVTAARKGGYSGPIALELRNLPAQVTAPKTEIAAGQTTATIELSAAPTAPLVARADVDVLGAIALGQQQNASPPFAVKVQAPTPSLALKVEPGSVTLKPGSKAKAKVTVERKQLAGPVVLSVAGLPATVTAAEVTLPADQNSGEIEFVAQAVEGEPVKAEATVMAKSGTTTATAKVIVQIERLMDR